MKRKKKQDETGLTDVPGRKRITPVDVQQREFRLSFRGYNERDVDEFLDEITEELALLVEESKQLRERASGAAPALALGLVPGGEGADAALARDEGERVLQDAREEAARIVARAREEAAAVDGAAAATVVGAGATIGPFLGREREFLQSLASLIQEHAESVKSMARAAREREAAATESLPPGEPATDDVPHAPQPARATASSEGPAPKSPEPETRRPILSAPQIPKVAAAPVEERPEPGPEKGVEVRTHPVDPQSAATPVEARPAVTPVDAQRITLPEAPAQAQAAPEHGAETQRADAPSSGSAAGEVPSEGDDRSLRELFWGED